MAKAQSSSDNAPSTPAFGKELELRLPFCHPVLGQVIQARIIRHVTPADKLNPGKIKSVLVCESLNDWTNGADKDGVVIDLKKGDQFRFDVRGGYHALFEMPDGTEFQAHNKGQTIDTGKPHKGWDWSFQYR